MNFTNGFNVLCGETGAGKSIIIKALDSVLGAKLTKDVVLNKDIPCYIEAVFENNGIETIISREISSQSKFRLNGMLSSVEEIKEYIKEFSDKDDDIPTKDWMIIKDAVNWNIIKKVYVYANDGGEMVQIAISLTCPKLATFNSLNIFLFKANKTSKSSFLLRPLFPFLLISTPMKLTS